MCKHSKPISFRFFFSFKAATAKFDVEFRRKRLDKQTFDVFDRITFRLHYKKGGTKTP